MANRFDSSINIADKYKPEFALPTVEDAPISKMLAGEAYGSRQDALGFQENIDWENMMKGDAPAGFAPLSVADTASVMQVTPSRLPTSSYGASEMNLPGLNDWLESGDIYNRDSQSLLNRLLQHYTSSPRQLPFRRPKQSVKIRRPK